MCLRNTFICSILFCLFLLTSCAGDFVDIKLDLPIQSGIVRPRHPSFNHSMVILEDGSLWAWGNNENGQLGDGTVKNQNKPVKIMENVSTAISEQHKAVVLQTDGTLWTIGEQLVRVLDNVVSFDALPDNLAAIQKCGSLWIWGDNYFGQIGDGGNESSLLPVKIMDSVSRVSLSGFNTMDFTFVKGFEKEVALDLFGFGADNEKQAKNRLPFQCMGRRFF